MWLAKAQDLFTWLLVNYMAHINDQRNWGTCLFGLECLHLGTGEEGGGQLHSLERQSFMSEVKQQAPFQRLLTVYGSVFYDQIWQFCSMPTKQITSTPPPISKITMNWISNEHYHHHLCTVFIWTVSWLLETVSVCLELQLVNVPMSLCCTYIWHFVSFYVVNHEFMCCAAICSSVEW